MTPTFPLSPLIEPMLAKLADELPAGDAWLYEHTVGEPRTHGRNPLTCATPTRENRACAAAVIRQPLCCGGQTAQVPPLAQNDSAPID